ncbi:hypothetical protein JCM8097_009220 [Rhodosporidiobolus ruineniae]
MAPPKRPVEVLVLDSDSDDDIQPTASTSSRSTAPSSSRPTPAPTASTSRASEEDQFEADLARAMAASLAHSTSNNKPTSASTTGNGNNDRAEMERARLERQKQREAVEGPAKPPPVQVEKGNDYKRRRVVTLGDLPQDDSQGAPSTGSSSSSFSSSFASTSRPASSASSAAATGKDSERFWTGAVKRVPSLYYPSPSSWSFSDLIGPRASLQSAIVSAFVLDPVWVVQHFPTDTPLLLVMPRSKGDTEDGELAQVDLKPMTFRVIPPDNAPGSYPGCMHTKLMVYYHTTFVRLVIPTANAISYDWDAMDNAVYVHDFPLLPSSSPLARSPRGEEEKSPFRNPTHTQFSRTFAQVLYKLGVVKRFLVDMRRYDFSQSSDIRLVQSMQGRWSLRPDPSTGGKIEADEGGGICSLAKAVKSLGFAPGGRWEIEATGSSIGRYTPLWLSQMLAACQGVHPSTYFTERGKEAPPARVVPVQGRGKDARVDLPIKIVFPTKEYVLGSFRGVDHGGTLFCSPKTWSTSTFPKHLFHRGESKDRDRQPAHTKIILALHKPSPLAAPAASSPPPVHEGWMYVGSHNFTSSAWGNLQNGALNGPEISINNYELGVVLPIRASSAADLERKATEMVTYKRPLVPYGKGTMPWQQDLYRD